MADEAEAFGCSHGRCIEVAQEGSGLCAWCCHADDVDAFRKRRCPHCGERFKSFEVECEPELELELGTEPD